MSVAVAVSGGRDSLLALALLRQTGRNPLAVHAFLAQKTPDRVLAALRENCRILGVNLVVVDLREQFAKLVIAPYLQSYLDGQTPNPCVWCNARIKFGLLFEAAQSHGAQILATGHYAGLRQGSVGPELWRGADQSKDQSYFLALVTPDQLRRAAFPLERQHKPDVLPRLEALGLVPALSGESQEVCFIPGDYRDFIAAQTRLLVRPGPIVLPDGRQVGEHRGLWQYTIGQRKGLNIAWNEPLYVQAKERTKNRLVVAPRSALRRESCRLEQANFLVPMKDWAEELFVQTRYRQKPEPLGPRDQVLAQWPCLHFAASCEPRAPGQLAVVYSGRGQVLAGAVIGEDAP